MNLKLIDILLREGSGELIVVDVQPGHKSYITFDIYEFVEYLNNYNNNITFLYNGPDLGYENENEIIYWYADHGLNQDIINNSIWFEKNFGFFRDIIDDFDIEDAIEVLGYMHDNDINDSRELNENDFQNIDIPEQLQEDLQTEGRVAYMPEVIDVLERISNPTLVGGGKNQCLKEIEICLQIINKSYNLNNTFIY